MDYKDIPSLPGVYRIFNSKKSYIGSSINMRGRVIKHNSYLKSNVHSNQELQRSFNKNKDDFKVEVLKIMDNFDRELILDAETFYHNEYNSVKNGFNVDLPRLIPTRFTMTKAQTDKAIRKSCKKVLAFDRYTGILYKEYNSVSDAARDLDGITGNICKACKGGLNHMYGYVFCYKDDFNPSKEYKFDKHYKKGTKISNEYKLAMRNSSTRSIPVFVYDKFNNFVEMVRSKRECEEKYGLKYDTVRYKIDKDILTNGVYFKSNNNLLG